MKVFLIALLVVGALDLALTIWMARRNERLTKENLEFFGKQKGDEP